MTPTDKENSAIRQYLLGNLSQEDQQHVEERLLTEGEFLESLLLGEDELIDDYINDELPGDDRLKFERHFLSTAERQQKYRFALALNRYTANAPEQVAGESTKTPTPASPTELSWAGRFRAYWQSQSLAFRVVATVASLAIIIGTVWFVRPRAHSPQTFVALTLSISASDRSTGPQAGKVKLPLGADALRIILMLPEGVSSAPGYRSELINESGEIRQLEVTGRDDRSVTAIMPATQLVRGQYALKLFAVAADGTEQRVNGNYFFTVE